MYDTRKLRGSFKEIIGEYMFQATNKHLRLTHFYSYEKIMRMYGQHFNNEQKIFLSENWNSIDAIELPNDSNYNKIVIYEIKTKKLVRRHL